MAITYYFVAKDKGTLRGVISSIMYFVYLIILAIITTDGMIFLTLLIVGIPLIVYVAKKDYFINLVINKVTEKKQDHNRTNHSDEIDPRKKEKSNQQKEIPNASNSKYNKGIVLDKLNKPAQKEDIGIRFEISKVNDTEKFQCGYGEACWRIFWQAVDIKLLAGALLRDGDTNDTPDHENVYCISITWPFSGKAVDVRKSLEEFEPYNQVAANPNFIYSDQLAKEPLVQDGIIDQNGQFVGTSYRALRAFENIQKEKMSKETKSVEQSTLSCKLCSKSITDYHYSFESIDLVDVLGCQCPRCGKVLCIAHWEKLNNDNCPDCGVKMISLEEGPAYLSMVEGAMAEGRYNDKIRPPGNGRKVKQE